MEEREETIIQKKTTMKTTLKIVAGFIAGTAIGVTVGFLFAPYEGTQARSLLSAKAKRLAGTMKDSLDQAKGRLAGKSSA